MSKILPNIPTSFRLVSAAYNFIERETPALVLSCEFWEIFQEYLFFAQQLRVNASELYW